MKTQTVIASAVKTANLAGKLQTRLVAHCAMAHVVGRIEGVTVKAVDELLKASLTAYVGTRSVADYVKIGKGAAKSFDAQFSATIAAGSDNAGTVAETVGLIVAGWAADGLVRLGDLKERYAPAKGAPRGATAPKAETAPAPDAPAPDATAPEAEAPEAEAPAPDAIAARLAMTADGIAAMVAALEAAGFTVAAPASEAEQAAA